MPFGLSWFPSKEDKKYIVVRVADPKLKNKSISKYISLAGVKKHDDLVKLVNSLVEYRDRLGSALWDDWPDVVRPRTRAFIKDLPKGVSCFVISSKSKSGYKFYISVTSYWQDYSKPKNKKGQYKQAKKTFTLPIDSPLVTIREKIAEAKSYREAALKENPKPNRA